MKQLLLFVALAGLAQVSCKKTDCGESAPASIEGKWRMIVVKDILSGITTTKSPSIPGDVDITFTSTGAATGTFVGITPTNVFGQNDFSTGANQSLEIPSLSISEAIETTWGKEFVGNISESQSYNLESGNRLNIKTAKKVLTFQRR